MSLTNLGLSWYGGNGADFAAFDGVNNAAFANVRVSNKSDGNLLFVGVQLRELAKKLD